MNDSSNPIKSKLRMFTKDKENPKFDRYSNVSSTVCSEKQCANQTSKTSEDSLRQQIKQKQVHIREVTALLCRRELEYRTELDALEQKYQQDIEEMHRRLVRETKKNQQLIKVHTQLQTRSLHHLLSLDRSEDSFNIDY